MSGFIKHITFGQDSYVVSVDNTMGALSSTVHLPSFAVCFTKKDGTLYHQLLLDKSQKDKYASLPDICATPCPVSQTKDDWLEYRLLLVLNRVETAYIRHIFTLAVKNPFALFSADPLQLKMA